MEKEKSLLFGLFQEQIPEKRQRHIWITRTTRKRIGHIWVFGATRKGMSIISLMDPKSLEVNKKEKVGQRQAKWFQQFLK